MLIPLFTVLNKANSVPKNVFREKIAEIACILARKFNLLFVGGGVLVKYRLFQLSVGE